MALNRSKVFTIVPAGLTDSPDAGRAFPGAMGTLSNLIPFPGANGIWQCRPAAARLTAFPAFNTPGFISLMQVIGSRVYGMISSLRNAGNDEPFVYDIPTGLFIAVSGTTAANTPASPASSGAWTPPTLAQIGSKIIITHPGFNAVGGFYFGTLDISNPGAPAWSAGNLTGGVTAFSVATGKPTVVAQFSNRCYFAAGNFIVFSDVLNPANVSFATNVLTLGAVGSNQPITALVGLPLNALSGGIIQSLIAFIGTASLYQITGDATSTSAPLQLNQLNVQTGTYNQNSVTGYPGGLVFVAPDGLRTISYQAQISDPIGFAGQGVTLPFFYLTTPSRTVLAYSSDVLRVSLQNALTNTAQEYFYHFSRKTWSGPHTFPASLISPYQSSFIATPLGIPGGLWQSNAIPGATNTYTENGVPLQFAFGTPLVPDNRGNSESALIEATLDMALNNMDTYTFSVLDEQASVLSTATVKGTGQPTVWGSFLWGASNWLGVSQNYAPRRLDYDIPVVYKRAFFVGTGPCSQPFRIGVLNATVEDLEFLMQ